MLKRKDGVCDDAGKIHAANWMALQKLKRVQDDAGKVEVLL